MKRHGNYIVVGRNLKLEIELGTFQPFSAMCSVISRESQSAEKGNRADLRSSEGDIWAKMRKGAALPAASHSPI